MLQSYARKLHASRLLQRTFHAATPLLAQNDETKDYTERQRTIDFGFQEVDVAEKAGLVAAVFSNVAPSYDVMNDLMSGGLHRLWKDHLVQVLRPFEGMQHLDVAGGTGDVAFRVLKKIQEAEALAARRAQAGGPGDAAAAPGMVTVCDINEAMLQEGQKRAEKMGISGEKLHWVHGDAEKLPFEDGSFDAYTVTFGIRNVTNRDAALREAVRVLRKGGRFLCMEFSQVNDPILRQLYDTYSFNVIPAVGGVVAGDRPSYQYLVESIRMFPSQEEWKGMIEEAGFRAVSYENILGGVVALHSGFKL